MTSRRQFLKALACVPVAPVLLRGMSWAAPTTEELKRPTPYSAEVPPGTILPFAGEGCPPGYLPCDGRAVPRFAYKRLYEATGAAYGVGALRGTFRVPDLRARARPAAAVRADERSAAVGQAPAYLSWRYVIRS